MQIGTYNWICKFTYPNDNLECHENVLNDCKTFKQLRIWWRKEKPNLKLISATLLKQHLNF